MKDFAGYLRCYFKEKGITYSNASKMCGIDRTLLSRYGNGGRLPKKESAVERLARGLQMAGQEEQELLEAYRRTKVCREYQVEYSAIGEILEGEHRLARPADDGKAQDGDCASF